MCGCMHVCARALRDFAAPHQERTGLIKSSFTRSSQSQIHGQKAVFCRRRLVYSGTITVNLAFTRTSGAALTDSNNVHIGSGSSSPYRRALGVTVTRALLLTESEDGRLQACRLTHPLKLLFNLTECRQVRLIWLSLRNVCAGVWWLVVQWDSRRCVRLWWGPSWYLGSIVGRSVHDALENGCLCDILGSMTCHQGKFLSHPCRQCNSRRSRPVSLIS